MSFSMAKYAFILISIFILPLAIAKRSAPHRLSANASCGSHKPAYYVDDGVELRDAKHQTITANVTEKQCLRLCSANTDAAGVSAACAYATYEPSASTCNIYAAGRIVSAADRAGSLGRRTFEKFCLSDDLPADCSGRQFVRVNEYILKGYAQATATFSTLAECAAHCVREREFQCKSVMYFYEEGECITNSESAITKPDDFQRPEDDDKVIFVHNGCIDHHVTMDLTSTDPQNASINVQASEDERPAAVASNQNEIIASSTVVAITTLSTDASEIATESTITAIATTTAVKTMVVPEFSILRTKDGSSGEISQTEGSETVIAAPRRLYGATQLDTSSINSETVSQQESKTTGTDGGPEHAPSGHFVVEDIILPATVKDILNGKIASPIDVKTTGDAKAPGIPPPQSGFVLSPSGSGNDDEESTSLTPLNDKIHATPKSVSAPHALVPKMADVVVETTTAKSMKSTKLSVSSIGVLTTVATNKSETQTTELFQSEKIHDILMNKLSTVSTESTTTETNALPVDDIVSEKLAPTKKLQLKSLKSADPADEGVLFSAWSDWTPCRLSGERRIRRRKCLDLRRCKGALMQVDYCASKVLEQPETETTEQSAMAKTKNSLPSDGPAGPPIRNPLPIKSNGIGETTVGGLPPAILPNKLPEKNLKLLPAGAPGRPNDIWSPWIGGCQQFVSPQPCKNEKMIGFESRECIAKDPTNCKEPFFRYCTLPC